MTEYENASQEVKREYDDQINKHGRITNMKRTLLHNVPAFHAYMEWYTLYDDHPPTPNLGGEKELLVICKQFTMRAVPYIIKIVPDAIGIGMFFADNLFDKGLFYLDNGIIVAAELRFDHVNDLALQSIFVLFIIMRRDKVEDQLCL